MNEIVSISAEVTGDDGFYFWEGRKWGALSEDQLLVIAAFLADMADLAQDLGQRGEAGDLTAVLRQDGIPGVQNELVVKGFSKDDMTRFQHRFANGWARVIDAFSDRRKGRAKQK